MGFFWKRKAVAKQFRKDVDPNDLPLAEVWEEFTSEVRTPGGGLFVEDRRAAAAIRWLRPPTACSIAGAVLRFSVSVARLGQPVGDMDCYYEGGKPPETTLDGAQSFVVVMRSELKLFYDDPEAEGEFLVYTLSGRG